MTIHLLVTLPNWDIPWAGLGAVLLGLGSALSGYAALITARRNLKEKNHESSNEDDHVGGIRVVDGGGSGVSGSGSN